MNGIAESLKSTLVKMGLEVDELDPNDSLADDLGMESLMRKELGARLERQFGVEIAGRIQELDTVGDLLEYLERSQAANLAS